MHEDRIRIRRAYEAPGPDDGRRILVDRLWPRGIAKETAHVDDWAKEVAPSNELRRWFGHDPAKWAEFQERYRRELDDRPDVLEPLLKAARSGAITLVYGAKDECHNQAVALRSVLEDRLRVRVATEPVDIVGEASYESFPASDSPGWATGRARATIGGVQPSDGE